MLRVGWIVSEKKKGSGEYCVRKKLDNLRGYTLRLIANPTILISPPITQDKKKHFSKTQQQQKTIEGLDKHHF